MSFALALKGVLGASRPFSPARIPGYDLDVDSDTGVTLATGVKTWADQRGPNFDDFVQNSVTRQPGYTLSDPGANGHASLNFDGVAGASDYMTTPGKDPLRPVGGFLWAIAGKFPPPGTGFSNVTSKNGYWILRVNSTGTVRVFIRNAANTAWQQNTTTGTIPGSGYDVIMVNWDGATTGTVMVGGAEETWPVTSAYSGAAQHITLGQASATTPQMDLVRGLGYTQPVSAVNRAKLRAYLQTEYGF